MWIGCGGRQAVIYRVWGLAGVDWRWLAGWVGMGGVIGWCDGREPRCGLVNNIFRCCDMWWCYCIACWSSVDGCSMWRNIVNVCLLFSDLSFIHLYTYLHPFSNYWPQVAHQCQPVTVHRLSVCLSFRLSLLLCIQSCQMSQNWQSVMS